MPNPLIVSAGASIGGGLLQAGAQRRAAASASQAQVQAAQLTVEEQRRQFNLIRQLAEPYVQAGNVAQQAQMDLMGLGGVLQRNVATNQLRSSAEFRAMTPAQQNAALARIRSDPQYNAQNRQRNAISGITNGNEYQTLLREGENAITSNASATGGLRGGNVQAALGQFAPGLLNGLIDKQLGRYGGLAAAGQNAVFGVGAAGQNAANAIGDAYGQSGAAQAGNALARGNATSNFIGGAVGQINGVLGGIEPPVDATAFGRWGF